MLLLLSGQNVRNALTDQRAVVAEGVTSECIVDRWRVLGVSTGTERFNGKDGGFLF